MSAEYPIIEAGQAIAVPLSQSRYRNMACPHLYRAALQGEAADSLAAVRGREIHDFMADYVDHLVNMELEQDLAWFDFQLKGRGFSEGALEIIEQLRDISIQHSKVLHVEKRLFLDAAFQPVESADEATYEGKPDLVLIDGDTAIIPDYKSQWKIESAETFQAALYSLLVMTHYPFILKVVFELQFVRWKAKRATEYTREDIPHLQKQVQAARTRQMELHVLIEQGVKGSALPALPGAHCVGCPLLHKECPLKDNPFSESPQDALRQIVWATQLIKRMREVVNRHLSFSGDIGGLGAKLEIRDANGETYCAQFKLVNKSEYPLDKTLEIIETWKTSYNEDLKPRLLVGATDLNRLAKTKGRQPLREMLDTVREVTPQTKLCISGVEDGEE